LRAAETGSLNPSLLSGEGSPGASRAGEESRCARPPGLECDCPDRRGRPGSAFRGGAAAVHRRHRGGTAAAPQAPAQLDFVRREPLRF
jgi:hypothetical protein